MPRVTTGKHLTSDPAYQEDVEKVRRYTFLDKMTTTFGPSNRKGVIDCEFKFPEKYNGLFSVKYVPGTTQIIGSFGTGEIQVFESTTGTLLHIVRDTPKRPMPIMCVRCVPHEDDLFFAAGTNGNIYKCRCEDRAHELYVEEKQNEINSIDINQNSQSLISGGKDAIIRLYDLETGKLRKKWLKEDRFTNERSTTQFHMMRIFCVKFHNFDNNMFLSGGWDKSIKIWDIRTKESCVKVIMGPIICGDALDVKDKQVLTGSWTVDNSIQLWDLGTSRLITNINPINRVQTLDGEFLYCCQFFKGAAVHSDIILAGVSGIEQMEIISIKEEKILNAFKAQKTIQAIDSDAESHIVFGGMESVIRGIKF